MEAKLIKSLYRSQQIRENLYRFERSQLLEVYFARLDGIAHDQEHPELNDLSLADLKSYLWGRFHQDPLLEQISLMNSPVWENNLRSS